MDAPTTIRDLPDDMLHEIFGHVFAGEPNAIKTPDDLDTVFTFLPPHGAHRALRCVCRRWRDIADWVRLATSLIMIEVFGLADPSTVRARHPAAFKDVGFMLRSDAHSPRVTQAVTSLINGSADLRRTLSTLSLQTCCLRSLVPAVLPIASCPALAKLSLTWRGTKCEGGAPSNLLAPLSGRPALEMLELGHVPLGLDAPSASALTAPLPALPDAPSLTCLIVRHGLQFVPVGSDAALGRLRRLVFDQRRPLQELVDVEDPFALRAKFDAGAWQPSRLTALKELHVTLRPLLTAFRGPPPRTRSRSGAEWAPLASQVTELTVRVESAGYRRPSTGIVAGLGALTALRSLTVNADACRGSADRLQPVALDRVRAPHLTFLDVDCVATPADVSRFPDLVELGLASISEQPPLNVRSLVARSSLKILQLRTRLPSPRSINLADLFVGGGGWPVLEGLWLENMVLEWDATDADGAPSATEFAARAWQLLPALEYVDINEPRGPGALPDPSRARFVVACRRHVVPALKGLHAGGD